MDPSALRMPINWHCPLRPCLKPSLANGFEKLILYQKYSSLFGNVSLTI
jgi:hypothetical protein